MNMKLPGVKSFPFKTIIFQFWRPLADHGRQLLECYRNAYAYPSYNRRLRDKYRPCSTRYHYSIDDPNPNPNPNPGWIISGGPVATAFLNHSPEVVLDLRAHQGLSPLVVCGLECDLTCCVMLPVFYCECVVGVVECSMEHPSLLLKIFNELKRQLERVGMNIYHLQGSWPYKTISGDLDSAKMEIEKALEIACESHHLTLGQVWISYETETKNDQTFLVKLSRYSIDSVSSIKDFYDKLDVIPLKSGEGLVGKTLRTRQLHVCSNIYKLSESDNKGKGGLLALLSANTKCASFVICLRSAHTRELDYVFEFFWPCGRNNLILFHTLLLTLNKYLPSFKLASGEQFGDVNVKVLSENELSNLEGEDDDDDLAILATYRNELSLFNLPRSSMLENVMEKLKKEFELDPARTYKLENEVSPGRYSSLVCLESSRRMKDMGLIKLRVRADGKEVGWKWITNS